MLDTIGEFTRECLAIRIDRKLKPTDVMTTEVVAATEDTSPSTIAALLERHRTKRVPIPRDGKVVGIVSRANLLQAFAGTPASADTKLASDDWSLCERSSRKSGRSPGAYPGS